LGTIPDSLELIPEKFKEMSSRVYTTKPNARRAARKAGLDPAQVREVPGAGFAFEGEPPARTDEPGVSAEDLAWLYACSTRHIEQLAERSIAVRLKRGRYDDKQTTRNYVRHLREQAASRAGQEPGVDGVAASVALKTVNTELAQLRLRREMGEVLAISDIRDTWSAIVRALRQFVLALPGKIAFEVPTLNSADRKAIDRICRDGLQDASLARGFGGSNEPAEEPEHAGSC
jgi:phage terminase Nu1 subunit (DNA packaging protein)